MPNIHAKLVQDEIAHGLGGIKARPSITAPRKIENVDWLIFALIGTISFSAAGVLDKFMLSSYASDSKSYIVCQAIAQQIFTIPIFLIVGADFTYPASIIALLAGALQVLPAVYYLRAMKVEEASRVAALVYLYPLFVFLGATLLLGESLGAKHYAGVMLLLASAFLISYRHGGSSPVLSPALKPFISYWIVTAAYYLVLKCLLSSMDEWDLYIWASLGDLIGSMPLLINSDVRCEVSEFFGKGSLAIGALLSEEVFQFLGTIFSIFAYAAGSVTLVTSVGALQPIITLGLVIALGIFLPGVLKEELDRNSLIQKSTSFILVVVGIYFIC